MYYAMIDKEKKCVSVFGDNKKRTEPNMIELGDEIDVLGKTWNGTTWEGEGFTIPEPEEEISQDELLQAEILLSQQEILINQRNQDEVLAEILLIQVGGMLDV